MLKYWVLFQQSLTECAIIGWIILFSEEIVHEVPDLWKIKIKVLEEQFQYYSQNSWHYFWN